MGAASDAWTSALHVLIVEDDYFLADDMRRSFRTAGVEVIGPVPTAEAAIRLIETSAHLDAAVLDVNLREGDIVFPVADVLRARGILFVFATGFDAASIPERFADVRCFDKPCKSDQVLRFLSAS